MNNIQYINSIQADPGLQARCLEVMEKYGDNHWWEPGVDPLKMAWYQLNEDVMLVARFSIFHGAVEQLLGCPVWIHEFSAPARLIERAKQVHPELGEKA